MRAFCLATLLVIAGATAIQAQEFKPATPADEHKLLKRFAGEWECENEAFMVPGEPAMKSSGTMTGKMIGDFWVTITITVEGDAYRGQGTFGFDSLKRKRYSGTWSDSMSPFLWHYDGVAEGSKLLMNSEGPNPAEPDKMVKARDTWEFKGDDLILLTGQMEGPDGKMITMMKATCRRKK